MKYDDSKVCLAWLASASLSPKVTAALLDCFESPAELYSIFCSGKEKDIFNRLPEQALQILKKNSQKEKMLSFERIMKEEQIDVFTIKNKKYPDQLTQIDEPPAIIFTQGDTDIFCRRTVAVIGSRRASNKGLEATYKIAKELSQSDVSVISGLAYGIDSAAHRGCLDGSSPTAAVIGCGCDIIYPSGNDALKEEILRKGGLILSEYAPGEQPLGWHFPFRNRMISALANAVIVMEARIKSGSMTTVRHALDQGKEIFVYPGEAGTSWTEGNHQLLREGATYFTSADDILEDMRWLDKKQDVLQNNDCSVNKAKLSPLEKKILDCLSGGEMQFDKLCSVLHVQTAEMMSTLTVLQLDGLIDALPGKEYRIRQ